MYSVDYYLSVLCCSSADFEMMAKGEGPYGAFPLQRGARFKRAVTSAGPFLVAFPLGLVPAGGS